jgi:CRISPR-associated exonuclease Cas4
MDGRDPDTYLDLNGIQHFAFCRRQWALITLEDQWAENVLTITGSHLHEKADQPFIREKRGNKLIVRGMRIQSVELGIKGVCDVVECVQDPDGVTLFGESEKYAIFPVEYKRGKPKTHDADELQLTAQAMCLEEMLVTRIDVGYLYYDQIKRRQKVMLTPEKKAKVRGADVLLCDTAGQNALLQAKTFGEAVNVSGIVLTKLDGTAKGGIVIAIKHELGYPVKLMGLGEQADDLQPFEAEAFLQGLFPEETVEE